MPSKAAQEAIARRKEKEAAAFASAERALVDIAKVATKKVEHLQSRSQLINKEQLQVVPKFSSSEIDLGKVLGKGGFGTVKEIRGIKLEDGGNNGNGTKDAASHSRTDSFDEQEFEDRKFISEKCLRDDGDSRYCIKALSPNVIADKKLLAQGVLDMAVETAFLSAITHPHIITLRAYGSEGYIKPDYFIVLDRLYDTLESRIPKWRLQTRKAKSFSNKLRRSTSGKLDNLLETKLSYAYDLMGAFEYMHQHNLVYRDLKPENVGFNIRDDIVLFDFGLVREILDDDEKVSDGAWKLTGETGSLRYMAPEVAADKPYGHSCDMYSFGIMLWEMLSCEKPYKGFSKNMHFQTVVVNGGRPKMPDSWGPSLVGFVQSMWHQTPSRRPSAKEASLVLKREASKVGQSELQLNNFRRKSTFVNRKSLREKHRMASMELETKEPSMGEIIEQ